jgi:hypothetical protein
MESRADVYRAVITAIEDHLAQTPEVNLYDLNSRNSLADIITAPIYHFVEKNHLDIMRLLDELEIPRKDSQGQQLSLSDRVRHLALGSLDAALATLAMTIPPEATELAKTKAYAAINATEVMPTYVDAPPSVSITPPRPSEPDIIDEQPPLFVTHDDINNLFEGIVRKLRDELRSDMAAPFAPSATDAFFGPTPAPPTAQVAPQPPTQKVQPSPVISRKTFGQIIMYTLGYMLIILITLVSGAIVTTVAAVHNPRSSWSHSVMWSLFYAGLQPADVMPTCRIFEGSLGDNYATAYNSNYRDEVIRSCNNYNSDGHIENTAWLAYNAELLYWGAYSHRSTEYMNSLWLEVASELWDQQATHILGIPEPATAIAKMLDLNLEMSDWAHISRMMLPDFKTGDIAAIRAIR